MTQPAPLPQPRPRKAVAFCCDDRYRPFALFAASQIAALHPDRDFDICLCDATAPVIPHTLRHLGLRPVALEPGTTFAGFALDQRRSESAYHRLLLPRRLGNDYDRILYLDADVFIQDGDFSRLLDVPLSNPVAAVRDNPQWRTPARMPQEFRTAGLPNAPYFNSGVLLIDVPLWQDQGVEEQAIAHGSGCQGRLRRHDQTLLNIVLHRNWTELSPVWNWQYSKAARLHEAVVGANIVHFIGKEKPWNAPQHALPARFAVAMACFLREHFPDLRIERNMSHMPVDNRIMVAMLLRHLMNGRRMTRYLSRFPTRYCVLPASTAQRPEPAAEPGRDLQRGAL
ncbi:glycosyltransferase family 8 protein [Falsirhodobacter sp. 20TX0035]|uniref:glycosyltransferase family 8 protein n=1 Tax=Falsirhodobacter sp. 20TX0035 TaxID=3022019 RepID=UPI00232D3F0A|nr:glycosyltransferase family 8 protein [Falsirhodobacter sp. 20TX0035]MDB6452909.1 glycosyltransferase family 8 protein [Falsirhodobacter sp. 20TX0035]